MNPVLMVYLILALITFLLSFAGIMVMLWVDQIPIVERGQMLLRALTLAVTLGVVWPFTLIVSAVILVGYLVTNPGWKRYRKEMENQHGTEH